MSAAAAGPSLLPLLETLEDPAAPVGELTDAHLTIVNFNVFFCFFLQAHISSQNSELSSAALQALGFCVFNSKITSELSATEIQELLSTVNSIAVKTSDKNTRTRALWVISKQTFPSEIVGKEVPSIISTLETILTKGDVYSMAVEYEALNVLIRVCFVELSLMEQTPTQMGEEAVRWAKLIIPMVVHSAHKVQLRGAAALEMGMPLLLQKQQEVAIITEHLMTTKVISELQKLFSAKNETYVLKLWPLFVKLLGKTLHRSGSFINSLLQLEELGFRSGSPVVKKIAFIAWKSLIDNFALNPEILCSAKRLKLLMQPLSSIHVRTEALALTKLEVWWYLLVRLGPQLPANFEQVCVPLIQSTLSVDSSVVPQGTPSRSYPFGSPVTPRINLNSSVSGIVVIPSIQLLGIEMLLHFLMGPEVLAFSKQNKLVLSLEPLQYPLISSPSFFCKHASTLINAVQEGFIAIGKEVPDAMLNIIWKHMIGFVKSAIESGNKKERQGSEMLTVLLQALKNIVTSSTLPVQKTLTLIEITIKELPSKVLGSPAYQVADMDLLNVSKTLVIFFLNFVILVGCVLSGPTSPLAFSESVFCIINQCAKQVENKEHLWRMWSIVVNPLTEWINQTSEVNQGDALEHNFNAVYSALLLPINHIFPIQEFPQPSMKSLLRTWSELYRTFARCAALVATAEENLCCEELCAKISGLEDEALSLSMVDGLTHIVSVMVDCINFAPYGTKYQPKNISPQTPTDWSKKKKEPLGKLASLFKLLVKLINSFHMLSSKDTQSETLISVGTSIIAILHNIISHISLPSMIRTMFATLSKPLAMFYEKTKLADVSRVYSSLSNKLEKLLGEIIVCLQSYYTGFYDSDLLEQLSPLLCIIFLHKSKQIRNQSAQFWNATFAKATVLTYPEELKSILSQAKKKILLLLPGFESVEEDLKKSITEMVAKESLVEDSKKHETETVAKEPSVGNENTSNVSSSSSSSDVISGTPQPASRRQSFITLEKFDSSENRPFSPSALNRLSGASGTAAALKQESIDAPKTPSKIEKLKEENKSSSKSEFEGTVTGIKRLSRRQNKTQHGEMRQSKLLTELEQEKSIQESVVASHLENKSGTPSQTEETKCILDTQTQAPNSAVIESTTIEQKQIVDGVEEEEKCIGPNLDSKENTPPVVAISTDQISNDDNQVPQMSPNQKTLRRSSRRRSEIAENTTDSQDKENSHQKKDKRKDDEKSFQKRVPQIKEDASQKQKSVPEKAVDAKENANKKECSFHEKTAAEDIGPKESHTSGGLEEEMNKNAKKSESDNLKSEIDVQDSGSDITGQKKTRGRTRYQTRRASQGLLSSIENSESDSSETREESTKRKRSGKWKNKSDPLQSKVKEEKESQNQELSSQEIVTEIRNLSEVKNKGETSSEVDKDTVLIPQACEVKNKKIYTAINESTGIIDLAKTSVGGQNTNVEQNKTNILGEPFMNPCISEPVLKTRQANKSLDKQRTVTTTSDAVLSSEKPLQILECQHKRSKRMRRSKSYNCCGENSQQQDKSFTELKNADNHAQSEHKNTCIQVTMTALETSSNDSHFEERLSVEPCAMSTPLLSIKKSSFVKDSERGIKSENDLEGNAIPVEEDHEKLSYIKIKTCDPVMQEPEPSNLVDSIGQCLTDCISKESIESCLPLENGTEPEATEKEEMNQNGQMEEISDTETVNKPDQTKINEPKHDQNDAEKTENTPIEVHSPQDSEMKEEDLIFTETAVAATVPENVASDQEGAEESDNVDSPQKLKELDSVALVKVNESPSGVQTRCIWSPSASPSTSILKRGIKRHQEDDSPSPANKIRRVSFANPIYQEGLADDIDRRSPIVRSHSSSNSSPSLRSFKTSSNTQAKHITTPTKGLLSPGSRNAKFKSSKKCLITEMAKESLPCPTESVYPALVGCKAPVDIILPQITSNIWARGLGQLIRAKNIKTVGDLSTLTAAEIKTLPIRSPKVSNVKKALRGYHEQQVKARGFDEIAALEDREKTENVIDEKPFSTDEERLATDLSEPVALSTDGQPTTDLLSQVSALAAQLTSEDLHSYSGSQLFEMQEKLGSMTNCIMKNLQSRWKSPPHESSV
uniref:Replication timing regulatory factor 1 n=1 Tax=Chrysemys picta bellii TaxID=8478 RepID=A0A8C3IP00_CHRPI